MATFGEGGCHAFEHVVEGRDGFGAAGDAGGVFGERADGVERAGDRFILALDEKVAPAFGDFVLDKLPELYDAFRHTKEGT